MSSNKSKSEETELALDRADEYKVALGYDADLLSDERAASCGDLDAITRLLTFDISYLHSKKIVTYLENAQQDEDEAFFQRLASAIRSAKRWRIGELYGRRMLAILFYKAMASIDMDTSLKGEADRFRAAVLHEYDRLVDKGELPSDFFMLEVLRDSTNFRKFISREMKKFQ